MTDDKADFYDQKASTLRALADEMRFSESRDQLLNIARLFDRLSSRLRSREVERQAAD
jgi:hypothetical protein